jgi:hypothetical protein
VLSRTKTPRKNKPKNEPTNRFLQTLLAVKRTRDKTRRDETRLAPSFSDMMRALEFWKVSASFYIKLKAEDVLLLFLLQLNPQKIKKAHTHTHTHTHVGDHHHAHIATLAN